MATTTTITDAGIEVTAGSTVDTMLFPVSSMGWIVTNTGTHDAVLNVDGGTPTRAQPVGANGRYLPPGASVALPLTASVTYQDASDANTTQLLFSKG
jgi:hypothetical protein